MWQVDELGHAVVVKNCFTLRALWGTNFTATPFICNSSLKIRWKELQGTPDKSTSSSDIQNLRSFAAFQILNHFDIFNRFYKPSILFR
jgi:hypothetical protein